MKLWKKKCRICHIELDDSVLPNASFIAEMKETFGLTIVDSEGLCALCIIEKNFTSIDDLIMRTYIQEVKK